MGFGFCLCLGKGRKGRLTGGKGGESNNQKGHVARSFTFKELALATQNFREANLIGEGGFGSVYKGRLETGLASFLLPKVHWLLIFIYVSNFIFPEKSNCFFIPSVRKKQGRRMFCIDRNLNAMSFVIFWD